MGVVTAEKAGYSVTTDAKLESRNVASCVLESKVEATADYLFSLLADPNKHNTLFDSIEGVTSELLEDDGKGVQKWKVDYEARWKFWRVGGVMKMPVFMQTDKNLHKISFQLREPGFLREYDGEWNISSGGYKPSAPGLESSGGSGSHLDALASITNSMASVAVATGLSPKASPSGSPKAGNMLRLPTIVRFRCRMGPSISPPFPLNQILKGQVSHQAREMFGGLLSTAQTAGMVGGDEWAKL